MVVGEEVGGRGGGGVGGVGGHDGGCGGGWFSRVGLRLMQGGKPQVPRCTVAYTSLA